MVAQGAPVLKLRLVVMAFRHLIMCNFPRRRGLLVRPFDGHVMVVSEHDLDQSLLEILAHLATTRYQSYKLWPRAYL